MKVRICYFPLEAKYRIHDSSYKDVVDKWFYSYESAEQYCKDSGYKIVNTFIQ